jgi:hypothetical protein
MMRFLFGVVVGAVLIVGYAYVHDTMMMPPPTPGGPQPYVNWEQVIQAFAGR